MEWLTHSLPLLRHDLAAREVVAPVVARLNVPVKAEWTMARVAALLSPYYEKDVPQSVRIMEAEDWAEALATYPQWAIQNAVRWWKSEHNPDRRKRPLEGDIADRCRIEMQPVLAALVHLRQDVVPEKKPVVSSVPRPSQEERQEIASKIMTEVFAGKKIGGAT